MLNGWACNMHRKEQMHIEFWSENLKESPYGRPSHTWVNHKGRGGEEKKSAKKGGEV